MTLTSTFATLRNLFATSAADAREFLVSRVNVEDLQLLEGFADFDGLNELAYLIYQVRT